MYIIKKINDTYWKISGVLEDGDFGYTDGQKIGLTNDLENFSGTVCFQDIDTDAITNMSKMFFGCNALRAIDLSNFNTSRVTNMSNMFRGCRSLTEMDLSYFVTSQVTNMSYMFYDCSSLLRERITELVIPNGCGIQNMFPDCGILQNVNVQNGIIPSNFQNGQEGLAWYQIDD